MPRLELEIADQARVDIDEIYVYTLTTWGLDQAEQYAQELADAVEHVRDFPDIGKVNYGIRAGTRTLVAGRHRIHYIASETTLNVLSVEGPGEDRLRSVADDVVE